MRGHNFAERCSRCDEPAGDHCLRCGEIFCADHRPVEPRRCDDCEADYAERLAAGQPDPWFADIALLAGVGGTVGLVLIAGPAAGVVGAAVAMVVWSVTRYRELRSRETEPARLRSEFLAERSRLLEGPKEP